MSTVVSVQRLTLFCIISAIEEDLKNLIKSCIRPAKSIAELYGPPTCEKAKERMVKDGAFVDAPTEDDLLEYLDVGDRLQAIQRNRALLNTSASNLIGSISKRLNDVVPIRNRVMHGRPLDFDDLPTVSGLAKEVAQNDSFHWFKTREFLKSLKKDPGHVFRYEDAFEIEYSDSILHNLPCPDFDDTGFVGRQEQLERLKKAISGAFPVLTVLGEGGYIIDT